MGKNANEGRFVSHLVELRQRLINSFIFLAVFFVICYFFSEYIYGFLVEPYAQAVKDDGSQRRLIFTALQETFLTYLRVSFFASFFINSQFITAVPFVFILVSVWFLIAWGSHSTIIKKATSSKSLERKTNTRVYNLVENLCIAKGMKMPKIYVIEDDSLNAFASGISEKTFAVSFSRGIINKLDDKELEAVIAHELTHIINRDVRLLIISIVFVGVFAFITKMAFRSLRHIRLGGKSKKSGGIVIIILVIVLLGVIGYLFSLLFRFTLSRKRL